MTAQWNATQQQPAAAKAGPPRRALWVVLVTAAIVAAAVGGGVVGSALTATGTEPSNPDTAAPATMTTAADGADTHAQDVALCTKYAIINSAMPYKDDSAGDLLPAVTAMENAVEANPAASPVIRAAITDMVAVYYARMAAYQPLKPAGLSEPPPHSAAAEAAASDKVWAACGLDK